MLVGAAFADELASGLLPASAPELGQAFGVSSAWLAGLLLSVPFVLSLLVEPALLVRADRAADRRGFVRAGYLAMALTGLAAAFAPSPTLLVIAFALTGPFWGVGVGVAQAALVDADPAQAERAMTRWTLAGAVGDVAGPALLALAAFVGLGWRAGFLLVAAMTVLAAWRVPRLPRHVAGEDDESPSSLREALRRGRLVVWAIATGLCTLLDEIFLVLAAIHLAGRGAGGELRGLILAAMMGGGALGLVVLDRLLRRHAPRRLLAAASLVCVLLYVAWLAAPSLLVSALLAPFLGAAIGWQYPLAQAQAYRAAPGHANLVNALESLLEPIMAAAPLGLALLHDHVGAAAALAVLAAQPIVLLVLSLTLPSEP